MRFENLTESLIHELHDMIKPYILRRVKADVLKLPPKVCPLA
jgi:SNF2 family DNA or RNA helicase